MSDAKKPSEAKPISDVARPGKSAPSATSKPVIITNRPVLKDPMMVAATEMADPTMASNASSNETEVPTTKAEQIQPLAPSEPKIIPVPEVIVKSEASTSPSETITTDQPSADGKNPDTPVGTAAKAPSSANESDNDDSPSQTELSAKEIDEEAEKQAQHDAAINKLIESKRYFLTINAVEKRKTKRFIILGIVLSILLVAAWGDIALDAGLVKIGGVKPVTHFFSN